MKKVIVSFFAILLIFASVSIGHSGRTDSNGGHYNRSTGEYHYHHGYSEHQHPNGICPYESGTGDEPTVSTGGSSTSTNINDSNRIRIMETQIRTLQSNVGDLNNEVNNKKQAIKKLEEDKKIIHIIYIAIIIFLLLVIYYLYSNKQNKE